MSSPAHRPIEFGVYIPQLKFSFEEILDRVQIAERLGYDNAWFYDHFYSPGSPDTPAFEAWTLIAALASVTQKIRLGHLVLCNAFRHPALLAQMALSLDAISRGRVELGIGTGSYPGEFEEYGLPFTPFRERAAQLEEALQVIKALFTQTRSNFEGKYYQLKNAPSPLRPTQKPHPPITIGGGGEKFTLPLVARFADMWNCPTYSLGEFQQKFDVLKRECDKINRDPATLRISEEAVLVLAESEAELPTIVEQARRRYGFKGWGLEAGGYIGTPERIVAHILSKVARGITNFAFFFHDRATPESLELFATRVITVVKKETGATVLPAGRQS
jgi:F420-dependent oxidoreductase-like protein